MQSKFGPLRDKSMINYFTERETAVGVELSTRDLLS